MLSRNGIVRLKQQPGFEPRSVHLFLFLSVFLISPGYTDMFLEVLKIKNSRPLPSSLFYIFFSGLFW